DLAQGIKRGCKADIIVSNPPYISSIDMKALPLNVKQEPVLALDGGSDGLSIIRKLFESVRFYLKHDGFLIFEFGYNQAKAVEKIAGNSGIFKEISLVKDYNNIDRIFMGKKK
ncbi:MAG: peptide chain release factor N(5)-glutamine methyltransferase, partial [Candidatus Omnitrophota bacterium]